MSYDEFRHYGILRKSGRYPWGSGKDAYSRSKDFYAYIDSMKADGLSDRDIAIGIGEAAPDDKGYTITNLRDTRTIAKDEIVLEETHRAKTLRDKDWSVKAIAENMGLSVATVRARLKQSEDAKKSSIRNTAEAVRAEVDQYGIVDIGRGVSTRMGISPERLRAAVSVLRDEGYETYSLTIRNPGTKNSTNHLVVVPPKTGFAEASRMARGPKGIHTMGTWTENEGISYLNLHAPMSISSKRVKVDFAEDGGADRDGMIYIRPDVPDLSIGNNHYAQVRVLVDNTHFIKGVAIKKDDLPDGIDVVVHSNKSRDVGKLGALKSIQEDPDNPFGSSIKSQIVSVDPKTGTQKTTSAMNMVYEEGDWDTWGKSLPSQVLAKQPHSLIKSQLEVTRKQTQERLDEINSITNPVVRRKKLQDYADQIDSDAVDLKAAAMPHQRTQLLLSVPAMRKNEIYAPNFETGESVVLIRYPHGGRFEIPEVVVNNNNRTAKKLLGNAKDAIGVHPSVAERLSGADFDGDTVAVIPNKSGAIKGVESLGSAKTYYEKELNGYDPKRKYGGYEVVGQKLNKKTGEMEDVGNFPLMKNTGMEMGMITNLITDMSIQGAKPEHVVRAVKHSMVVIDAEKHKLNYRQSAIDNGITQLKKQYQGASNAGAQTLLSKATADTKIPKRKLRLQQEGGAIDSETGKLVYVPSGKMTGVYDKTTNTWTGEKRPVMETVKKLALEDDAFKLVQDPNNPVEYMYATHANTMKAMANAARLQASKIPNPPQNKRAKEVYRDEIKKLDSDLKKADAQRPLNRKAEIVANATIKQKKAEDPQLYLDKDRLQKVERMAKAAARARYSLEKPTIEITDRQWDAIQSGAVSANMLKNILEFADPKRVESLALPRKNAVMTSAISARAKAMLATGATTADVARALGVPASTLTAAIRRGDV